MSIRGSLFCVTLLGEFCQVTKIVSHVAGAQPAIRDVLSGLDDALAREERQLDKKKSNPAQVGSVKFTAKLYISITTRKERSHDITSPRGSGKGNRKSTTIERSIERVKITKKSNTTRELQ